MGDLLPIERWDAIENSGGPMLLLPERVVRLWSGTEGPDYDRACEVNGYLGVLSVGGEEGLVINDEPASTAMIPARDGNSLVIAKWTYGPDADSVARSLHDVRFQAFPSAEVMFNFGSSPQVLFQSAFPGTDVIDSRLASLLSGQYVASTLVFEPARDISLVLHWVRAARE